MYFECCTRNEYMSEVKSFMCAAVTDIEGWDKTVMWCPCYDCENEKKFPKLDNVYYHLLRRVFKERYHTWNKHDEEYLNKGEMYRDLPDGSMDQGQPPVIDMNHYLSDTNILGLDDEYCGFYGECGPDGM